MSKSKSTPAALPAPSEPIAPPAPAEAVELEIIDYTPVLAALVEAGREIEQKIAEKHQREQEFIQRSRIDMMYDAIEFGWIFLKAEAVFLVQSGSTGNEKLLAGRGQERIEKEGGGRQFAETSGLTDWLRTNFPDLSERTTRNWRNAARNCGLTAVTPIQDVRGLRTNNTLQGRKLGDLYALADAGNKSPEAELEEQRAQAVADAQRLLASIKDIKQLGIEKRAFRGMPKKDLQALDGEFLEMRRAIAEELKRQP